MPVIVSAVVFLLWVVIAWHQYQRGNLLIAAVCVLAGALLAIVRLKLWRARQSARTRDESKNA
jgi:Flp pilus assembly protein TadB